MEIQAYKSPKLEQNQKQGWDELGLDQDLLGQPPKKMLRDLAKNSWDNLPKRCCRAREFRGYKRRE